MSLMIQEIADFSHKLTACFGDLAKFESKIRQIADIAKIEIDEFEIDHLAVRVNTDEKAQQWKTMLLEANCNSFLPLSNLLKESLVNGRPIALLDLVQPLHFCNQAVSIIELPFPKGKIYPEEGWEHIEIVVPMQANENAEQWIERLCKRWKLTENLQIQLKISSPQVAGEILPNPTIAISLNNTTNKNRYTIKLHPFSIREICQQN